jgi:ATP-binding cassette, subfamily B, bacterial
VAGTAARSTLHLHGGFDPLRFTDSPLSASLSIPLREARAETHRLLRAASFARRFRVHIAASAAITMAIAALTAGEPLVLKYIFDAIGAADSVRALGRGVPLLLAIGVLRELADAFSNWLIWRTRLGLHYDLLEKTVERLHHRALEHQRREGVGSVLTRLDRSIQGFTESVTRLLFQAFPGVVYLVLAAAVMIHLEPRLAWVVLAFAPLPALIQAKAAPMQVVRDRSLLERWSRIYSRFGEVLGGLVMVRSFAMEDAEKRRFLSEVQDANDLVIAGIRVDASFAAGANLAVMLARIAAIAAGCVLVMRGMVTIGTLVAFLGYLSGLFGPVQGLSGVYQTVRRGRVSLDEIFAILDADRHVDDRPGARPLPAVSGEVRFDGVHFAYDRRGRFALADIDLTIRPGETVAVVGHSGSGKSTLASLLLRLDDPQRGAVRIDGVDLRDVPQQWWRGQVAVVLQDPLLFNDTVRDNIAYGRPDATLTEIEEAARAANAHDFILRLPEGYDTVVGERGGRLSLGQRQRVTIARALVRNAPVLILDEATSSLDPDAEAEVQEALERLRSGRSTLVIAHRLSTVVGADRILVLRDGRIVESGTHAELMHQGGRYAAVIRRQARGLLPDAA